MMRAKPRTPLLIQLRSVFLPSNTQKRFWDAPTERMLRLKKRVVRNPHPMRSWADIDDAGLRDRSHRPLGGWRPTASCALPKRRRGQRNSTSADIIQAVASTGADRQATI